MRSILAIVFCLALGRPALAVEGRFVLESPTILQGEAAVGYVELQGVKPNTLCSGISWEEGRAGFIIDGEEGSIDLNCEALKDCEHMQRRSVRCVECATVRIPIFLWICNKSFLFPSVGKYRIEFWIMIENEKLALSTEIGVTECLDFSSMEQILNSIQYPEPSFLLAFRPLGIDAFKSFLTISERSQYRQFLDNKVRFYSQDISLVKKLVNAAQYGAKGGNWELEAGWEDRHQIAKYLDLCGEGSSEIVMDFCEGVNVTKMKSAPKMKSYCYFFLH